MHFDILDEAFFFDPYPTLSAMRSEAPCWYDARLGAHVVTRYRDIHHVLRDAQFSAERVAQFGRGAPEHLRDKLGVCTSELDRWLLFRDPPTHTPLRRRLGRIFDPSQRVARNANAAVTAALAVLSASDEPDLVRDLAYPVPTRVLAEILGIPSTDIDRFKRWTTDIFALIGAGVADANAVELGYHGVTELRAYVLDLIRARRESPRDDMLSVLAASSLESECAIADDDIVGIFMTVIVAGHETTTNLITNALYGILADHRARDWVRVRGGITEDAVDELIRYDGSVFSLIRRARRDVSIAGQRIREGECVFAMLNAGNRDPEQFTDPDRIDFDRPRPRHLGFGIGLHACVGAAVARRVVSAAVSGLMRTWPDMVLEPGCTWQRNMSIRGLVRMPVRLCPSHLPRLGCEGFGSVPAMSPIAPTGTAATAPPPDLAENLPRHVVTTLRPADVREVREVVHAANEQSLPPLYPLSAGRNWGIGSRAPIVDGSAILDLGAMRRIRHIDLENGVAVVEPGVSQGALADRLAQTPFLLNVTTSCRDSSVIGNALDRGQGVLRLRSDELLGVEAVLGDGSLVATGVLAPSGGGLFARASGPDTTPLFCQSNFGVVTAAAISLVRRPERTSYVYASYTGESLPAIVACLAKLRRERVIDSIFYLSEMQLEPDQAGPPDFTLLGPLLGRARLVSEALEITREELSSVPGCKTMRTGEADALTPGDPLYHRGRNFLGIPSCEPLRKRFGTATCELDATSRIGWSVLQTLVPFDGRAIADALSVLKAGVDRWGLPAHPHISSVTPTALNLMTMIWFQRTPEHIARMRELRDELQSRLAERGYPHSRAGIDMLRRAMPAGRSRDEAWSQIKTAFDPNGIIAPGRYVIPGNAALRDEALATQRVSASTKTPAKETRESE